MPSLRALECFTAAAEASSITTAAIRLHMSQPALSQQISTLEREVGTPLLERLPRGVRLTAAGRAMLDDAHAALRAADRAVSAGQAVARGTAGQLRLACAESMTVPLLAPVIRSWRAAHPDIRITLLESSSVSTLVQALDNGQVDLALAPEPEQWTGRTETVGSEAVVVALPKGHELAADGGPVPFARLADHPLVHYQPDNGLGGWLDEVAAGHGVNLTAGIRTRHAATAAQLAAAGLGPALVPTTALPAQFPGVVRRLAPPLDRRIVVLLANPGDTLIRRFSRDLCRRGVPVPAALAAQLQAPAR